MLHNLKYTLCRNQEDNPSTFQVCPALLPVVFFCWESQGASRENEIWNPSSSMLPPPPRWTCVKYLLMEWSRRILITCMNHPYSFQPLLLHTERSSFTLSLRVSLEILWNQTACVCDLILSVIIQSEGDGWNVDCLFNVFARKTDPCVILQHLISSSILASLINKI